MPHTSRFVIKLWVHTAFVIASAFSGALTSAHAQTTPDSPRSPTAVAFAVVYDTSGSMSGTIPSIGGKSEAKYLIARRALTSVAARLEKFTAPPTSAISDPSVPSSIPNTSTSESSPSSVLKARSLDFGLYVFKLDQAATALPLAPFSAPALRNWLDTQGRPRDSTPLGLALQLAGQALLASPAPHKRLLVLTDGANSDGIEPEDALELLQRDAEKNKPRSSSTSSPSASNPPSSPPSKNAAPPSSAPPTKKQLQTQLDFILENQILLEAP